MVARKFCICMGLCAGWQRPEMSLRLAFQYTWNLKLWMITYCFLSLFISQQMFILKKQIQMTIWTPLMLVEVNTSPPHSPEPPNVVDTVSEPLMVPETPYMPPPPLASPPPVEPPVATKPDVCHSNRIVKIPSRLQDYSLEPIKSPRFGPPYYQHFFRNTRVT